MAKAQETTCNPTDHHFVQTEITPMHISSGGGYFPGGGITKITREYLIFCTKCGDVRPLK